MNFGSIFWSQAISRKLPPPAQRPLWRSFLWILRTSGFVQFEKTKTLRPTSRSKTVFGESVLLEIDAYFSGGGSACEKGSNIECYAKLLIQTRERKE